MDHDEMAVDVVAADTTPSEAVMADAGGKSATSTDPQTKLEQDDDGGNDNEDASPKKRRKTEAERAEERREKSLAEVLLMMDEYAPIIPDSLMDYYLARSGFECDDRRVKRLLALSAQKFISDIATDAFHHARLRQQSSTKDKKAPVKKHVLTVEDLSLALSENGINVKKPEYYT